MPEIVAGNIQFKAGGGGVLFTPTGIAMDPACCCGSVCVCPFAAFGDAPVFTLDFDATVYSDGADRTDLICDSVPVTIPLYPVGDGDTPFGCSWHTDNADEFFCTIDIGIQLYLDTMTCQWTLGFDTAGPAEGIGYTTRPAGASNYLGAYPDIDNVGSGTIIRNIVLS